MNQQFRQIKTIISLAWQKNLTYRFTVMAYRVGEIAEVLIIVLMWSAIYAGGSGMIKGFTLNEMITYVLMGNLFSLAVRNFLSGLVSRDIEQGRLSAFLVKPISYIKFVFINEIGRSFLATVLSVCSQLVIMLFFSDKLVYNTDPLVLILIGAMVFLALIIELMIGFLVGTIAFWTDDVDGIHATVERVKRFFAGGYFPLSLLPITLATAGWYLPFAYSFFVPASLYLGKVSLRQGLRGLVVQLVWIVILALIIKIVWRQGLRRYEATGS